MINIVAMTRRSALVSVCASATALATIPRNALAESTNPPDSIYAAIEAYRRAEAIWSQTVAVRSHMIDNGPDKEPDHVIAQAEAAEQEAWGPKEEAAIALIEIQPTTIAGAAALLRFAYERISKDASEFPQWVGTGETSAHGEDLEDSWQNLLLDHVANSLDAMIEGAA